MITLRTHDIMIFFGMNDKLMIDFLKHFLQKFHKFTDNSLRMVITWKTRYIQSLFPVKDKNDYKQCVIFKGVCSYDSRCICETKRHAEVRWNEHNNPTKNSEP